MINAGLGISLSSTLQGLSDGNGSFLPAQPTQSVFLESTNDTLNTIDGVYMLDILTNAKFDHAKINAKDTRKTIMIENRTKNMKRVKYSFLIQPLKLRQHSNAFFQ